MNANPYKSADGLLPLPSAATGTQVTPSGIANTYGAWAEMTAAASGDWRLAAIVVRPGTFVSGNYYEVQIGIGAAGAEVAVATVRGYEGTNSGGAGETGSTFTLAAPADVISSGQRVSARLSQVSTNTSAWSISLSYWVTPVSADSVMPTTTVGPVSVPPQALLSATTNASIDTYGSWVEVDAATASVWHITDILCHSTTNFLTWGVQIGLGAAGSEVATWTVYTEQTWFAANAWEGGPWTVPVRPTWKIPAGTRVAVRVKCINSAGAKTASIGLTVVKADITGLGTEDTMSYTDYQQLICTGGGWTADWSPWTTFIASTSTPILVCQLASSKDNTGLTWYQIATGSAGNETLVASGIAQHGVGFGGGRFNITLPYARYIGAGERVSIRISVQGLSVGLGHYVALGYINNPSTTPDFQNWTEDEVVGEAVYTNLPTSLNIGIATNASAWVSGSWVEVDSSLPADRVLLGMTLASISVPVDAELDLGTGAAGSETVIHTVRHEMTDTVSGCSFAWNLFAFPLMLPASERFAVRMRCSRAAATTFNVNFLYAATPVSPVPPTPTDWSTASYGIRCLRRTPHIAANGRWMFHKRLQVEFTSGIGNTNAPGEAPVAVLRTSDTGGLTWSSARDAQVGEVGEYRRRVQWWRLGRARDRVYELSWTDPNHGWAITQAFIDVEEGTS